MKKTTRTQSSEKSTWQEQAQLRLKEGVLIILAVLCIYLWMVLLTFDVNDPGFSQSLSQVGTTNNAGGQVGAWLADALFSVLGYFAWLFPLVLMLKTALVFLHRYQAMVWNGWLFALRAFGFILLLCSGAALAHVHFPVPENVPKNFNILGHTLGEALTGIFNVEGATLLLLACFLFGLTVYANLSWFKIMEGVGEITLRTSDWIKSWLQATLGDIQERKQSKIELRNTEEPEQPVLRTLRAERTERTERAEPSIDLEPVLSSMVQPAATVRAERREPVFDAPIEPTNELDAPVMPAVPVVPPVPAIPAASPRKQPEKPAASFIDSAIAGTLPPLALLDKAEKKKPSYSEESLQQLSRLLEIKLQEFGVEVHVESVHPGPVVTRFEIQLAPGVKVSRITNLAKDLARSLAMISVRVVEVIPGKTTVGIEIPNEDRQIVRFSEVLETPEFDEAKSAVTIALGHDIGGHPVIADLAKMPHLLVAGTTGSGKSVGVNAMILSVLFKSKPEDARLIMIDPKMLELSIYEGIPHLLCPVVTDMKEAANALRWCVAEMERRYKLMSAMGVRNLASYNRKVKEAEEAGTPLEDPLFRRDDMNDEAPLLEKLPTIVVVVDEFADMIMVVGKKVEELIARIAQKARAAGIHLILATQRPSVDVITGLIKANIPTRIAFQVSSKIDSRTILDQGGAEQLLGHGDMLYLPPGTSLPIRVHGAFVSDDEVHRVVDAWKLRGAPDYIEDILAGIEEAGSGFDNGGGESSSEDDPLYDEAVNFVTESRRASISSVQRKFKVGYNRAARMVEAMEMAGVVSAAAHNGSREVIAPPPRRD
ncbi:MAG: DNA translocase FtsK 4TM domain-containing protein [Pseudomonas sp.]|nr:DNA translocase FtsK 4TM domain-containing protein [Pseudomonas sp.]MDD2223770.1 DNA translocase FtsK 4TM domain-containing protein [Pseudomonas sp.]MDY0413783.1 DNA translocase FtsK 4TM domain-containing protein [Pseudomonas sp.]NLO53869.1 cell division protein FtsK [Gammaproteobacteria bacterium]